MSEQTIHRGDAPPVEAESNSPGIESFVQSLMPRGLTKSLEKEQPGFT